MKIQGSKRIVVKVGTSTLTHSTGKTNIARMAKLASVLADLKNAGNEIVLVSSGAISIGLASLGIQKRPDSINKLQAAASVGQSELMFLYDKFFSEYSVIVSQLLFAAEQLNNKTEKQHILDTFNQLLEYDVLPIINENDSVYVDELLNGDNDCLSAQVASLINADLLILLTDTDGLYDDNPNKNKNAKLISEVSEINENIFAIAGEAGEKGTGGFTTKVKAAKIATDNHIDVVVMNGNNPTNIYEYLNGEKIGTHFLKR